MSKVQVTESYLQSTANAIRYANDTNNTYTPGQFGNAIQALKKVLQTKTATQNGEVTPDSGYDGMTKVTVNVPNTYTNSDEGKVVSGGALISQTTRNVTSNGTYNTKTNDSTVVNVPNTYTNADEGKVVDNGALVAQTARQSPITINGTYQTLKSSSVVVNVPDSGSSVVLTTKAITANGAYDADDDNADGYSGVTVNVPNTYAAGDEGKVVSGGALVSQTSTTKTANGTYDTTTNSEVIVNVPNTYAAGDEGKVVDDGALVSQTTRNVTENGTYDTTLNNSTVVNVPNSYAAGDEGKVVDDGKLVEQTSTTITENGTVDTTTNNEVVVSVSNTYSAGDEGKIVKNGALVAQTARAASITVNGTYDTTENNSVTVYVPSQGGNWLGFSSTVEETVAPPTPAEQDALGVFNLSVLSWSGTANGGATT